MIPDVWAVWPTIKYHIEQSIKMIKLWHELGYKVGLLVNPPVKNSYFHEAELLIIQNEWNGFPKAANILCRETPGNIIAVVGDDIYPDSNHTAEEIGKDFLKTFPDTYGVMQPTGDKFGSWDMCATSPWIGRKFIECAYEGKGPYWEEYFHYFSDEELQQYATIAKSFQQREDVTQFHDHWQRKENPKRPEYLIKAKRKWLNDKKIFESRRLKGFPSGNLS